MSTNMKWGCCDSNNEDNLITCSQCFVAYHYMCLYATKKKFSPNKIPKDWSCPSCRESTQKIAKDDNTPVRQSQNESKRPNKRPAICSPPGAQESPITRGELREIMEEVLDKKLANIEKKFANELNTVKEELQNVNKAMEFMNTEYEEIVVKYNDSQNTIKTLEEKEIQTQLNMKILMTRVAILEQNARAKNIEIQCVPEKKSENLQDIIKEISNTVGQELKDDNIIRVTRTAKLNPEENKRPRSIVVEFSSPMVRDTVLAAVIKFNKNKKLEEKLNSTHLGFSGPGTPIFVAEHLSPQNKALHAAARQAAKEKNYKFVWVRGGRIFMRKNEDSGYILVRDKSVLDDLK